MIRVQICMMMMMMIMNILILCFFFNFFPSKSVMTSVSCQNHSKFSYFQDQFVIFTPKQLEGCFSLFWSPWPLHIFFAHLPLSSQYLHLIISYALLEQLMGTVNHFFLIVNFFMMMIIISHLNIKHSFEQLEASKLSTICIMVLANYKNIQLTIISS